MTKDIVTVDQGADVSADEWKESLLAASEEADRSIIYWGNFCGNTGRLLIKIDGEATELDKGEYYVNLRSCTRGYVCWKDGQCIDRDDNYSAFGAIPPMDGLKDHGPYNDERDGWKEQYSLFLKQVTPEGDGLQYIIKMSAKSQVNQCRSFFRSFPRVSGLREQDLNKMVPVINIGSVIFTAHNKKNHKPTFTYVKWVPIPEGMTVTPPPPQVNKPVVEEPAVALDAEGNANIEAAAKELESDADFLDEVTAAK